MSDEQRKRFLSENYRPQATSGEVASFKQTHLHADYIDFIDMQCIALRDMLEAGTDAIEEQKLRGRLQQLRFMRDLFNQMEAELKDIEQEHTEEQEDGD